MDRTKWKRYFLNSARFTLYAHWFAERAMVRAALHGAYMRRFNEIRHFGVEIMPLELQALEKFK